MPICNLFSYTCNISILQSPLLAKILLKHSAPKTVSSGKGYEASLLGVILSKSPIPSSDLGYLWSIKNKLSDNTMYSWLRFILVSFYLTCTVLSLYFFPNEFLSLRSLGFLSAAFWSTGIRNHLNYIWSPIFKKENFILTATFEFFESLMKLKRPLLQITHLQVYLVLFSNLFRMSLFFSLSSQSNWGPGLGRTRVSSWLHSLHLQHPL